MNILDENILNDQRQLLRMRRITSRQIGDDTRAKRMGTVIRVFHGGLTAWYLHAEKESRFVW